MTHVRHFALGYELDALDAAMTHFCSESYALLKTKPISTIGAEHGIADYQTHILEKIKALTQEHGATALVQDGYQDDFLEELYQAGIENFVVVDDAGQFFALERIYNDGKFSSWELDNGQVLLAKRDKVGIITDYLYQPPPWEETDPEEIARQQRIFDKEGPYYDALRKGDINFAEMEAEVDVSIWLDSYDKFHRVLKGQIPVAWPEWLEAHGFRDDLSDQQLLKANDLYWQEPLNAELKAAGFGYYTSHYLLPRPLFEEVKRFESWAPLSYLKDGEWVSNGSTGYLGLLKQKTGPLQWMEQVRNAINSLPDDAWVIVCDINL